MLRGMKRAIDVERGIDETSELTVGELRSMATDRAARLAALRRRWEATVDLRAYRRLDLRASAIAGMAVQGLGAELNEQFNNPYVTRFLAVRRTHDVLGMTMDEAYDWAAENIDDPAASGGRDTMMKSYQEIRPQVAKIDRIQRRPRARRRRS